MTADFRFDSNLNFENKDEAIVSLIEAIHAIQYFNRTQAQEKKSSYENYLRSKIAEAQITNRQSSLLVFNALLQLHQLQTEAEKFC